MINALKLGGMTLQNLERVIEQLYKQQSAKLLAVLTRLFGPQHFSLAEDVLQEAFTKALSVWKKQGIPDKPEAWLFSTAKNAALDVIRQHKNKWVFAEDLKVFLESEWSLNSTVEQQFSEPKIKDDQLRMIFACCNMQLKAEYCLPFILKVLCGLSVKAVARALLQPESVIKKRLYRTKQKLKLQSYQFPEPEQLSSVLDEVHKVLYLLFNEGFHSSGKQPLNLMFCHEAIGLTKLLVDGPNIANKETYSLLALMYFHLGRVSSRVDAQGFNIPIDLQDRKQWAGADFARAKQCLELAKHHQSGGAGRFFLEALIAQQHCAVANFNLTNWLMIVELYRHLVFITGSPVAELNLCIAIAYSGEIESAITQVEQLLTDKYLRKSHMPLAILAHFNAMAGRADLAYAQAGESMRLGGTSHEHRLLMQQIKRQLENP